MVLLQIPIVFLVPQLQSSQFTVLLQFSTNSLAYSKPTVCSRMLQREFPMFVLSISNLSVSSGIVLIPDLLDLLTISVLCILSELFFLPDLYIADLAYLVPWMVFRSLRVKLKRL